VLGLYQWIVRSPRIPRQSVELAGRLRAEDKARHLTRGRRAIRSKGKCNKTIRSRAVWRQLWACDQTACWFRTQQYQNTVPRTASRDNRRIASGRLWDPYFDRSRQGGSPHGGSRGAGVVPGAVLQLHWRPEAVRPRQSFNEGAMTLVLPGYCPDAPRHRRGKKGTAFSGLRPGLGRPAGRSRGLLHRTWPDRN